MFDLYYYSFYAQGQNYNSKGIYNDFSNLQYIANWLLIISKWVEVTTSRKNESESNKQ